MTIKIGDIEIEGDASYLTIQRILDRALSKHTNTYVPLEITTHPGMGVVTYTRKWCEDQGIAFMEVRTPMFDPCEANPIPYLDPETNELKFATMDYYKLLCIKPNELTVVMFDEFNAAAPTVQEAFSKLALDNVLFIYKRYTEPKPLNPRIQALIEEIISEA